MLATLGICLLASPANPQARSNPEERVKAAFLYKFAGYVEWPAAAAAPSPLVIGVMGDDGLADELVRLVGNRNTEARPVQVVRPKPFEPLPHLHVLFIGHAESDRLGALIRVVRKAPVLVVTDTEGAVALGSMINFKVRDGHVRFEVGLRSAQRSGLTLSARMLAVAQSVSTRSP
jgi:hypothetical protein